jgi:hydroxymethylpyrimidine/phosphomethylpyrimidine kinase
MSFNASDATGAGGLTADVATISAMGAHPLPVVAAIVLRDTAEVFEAVEVDPDTVVEQARHVLEDVTLSGWKVGFLGSAEGVSAVAEVLSDYMDVPLVAYINNVGWMPEDQLQPYLDAYRELILPQTTVLIGNHKTLTDFLLPDWEGERPPSARELAGAAQEYGAEHVLVTGMAMPSSKSSEPFVDNILASVQGAINGEKFERFEASFVGAGDTLSAAIAALLASGSDLHVAVSEALSFLDQALENGFQPGMGNWVPDRFFWALPSAEELDALEEGASEDPLEIVEISKPTSTRNVH